MSVLFWQKLSYKSENLMLISDFFQLAVENVGALFLIMWPSFN